MPKGKKNCRPPKKQNIIILQANEKSKSINRKSQETRVLAKKDVKVLLKLYR